MHVRIIGHQYYVYERRSQLLFVTYTTTITYKLIIKYMKYFPIKMHKIKGAKTSRK